MRARNIDEKIMYLEEALEKLAEADQLIRDANEPTLTPYTAEQIDARGLMLGKGIYQLVADKLAELQDEKTNGKEVS